MEIIQRLNTIRKTGEFLLDMADALGSKSRMLEYFGNALEEAELFDRQIKSVLTYTSKDDDLPEAGQVVNEEFMLESYAEWVMNAVKEIEFVRERLLASLDTMAEVSYTEAQEEAHG